MENILVSIIIPIYNVEQYLAQCLDSIYAQDIPESQYEVICVNDVSPDSSRDIVLNYKRVHDNLVYVEHEKNCRQGGARNTGLRIAKGKYIWFVDPDDYIERNVLYKLTTLIATKQVDILHFDYKRLHTDGNIEDYRIHYIDECTQTGLQFLEDESSELWWQRCVEVWRKIYDKKFLLDNQLFFEQNVMYEDTDWAINSLLKAQKVIHIDVSPYIYRENIQSVTQQQISPVILSYKVKLFYRCRTLLDSFNDSSFTEKLNEYIIYLGMECLNTYKSFTPKEKKNSCMYITKRELMLLCIYTYAKKILRKI